MNKEETEKTEIEINTVKQSSILLHKLLTKHFAEEFSKNKTDEDGFVPFKQGGISLNSWYNCDGWTMKKWIDKGDVTVVLPYFRLHVMGVTVYSWIHEIGPSETIDLAYHVIHS